MFLLTSNHEIKPSLLQAIVVARNGLIIYHTGNDLLILKMKILIPNAKTDRQTQTGPTFLT